MAIEQLNYNETMVGWFDLDDYGDQGNIIIPRYDYTPAYLEVYMKYDIPGSMEMTFSLYPILSESAGSVVSIGDAAATFTYSNDPGGTFTGWRRLAIGTTSEIIKEQRYLLMLGSYSFIGIEEFFCSYGGLNDSDEHAVIGDDWLPFSKHTANGLTFRLFGTKSVESSELSDWSSEGAVRPDDYLPEKFWDAENQEWVDSGNLELEATGGGRHVENFIAINFNGDIYFG